MINMARLKQQSDRWVSFPTERTQDVLIGTPPCLQVHGRLAHTIRHAAVVSSQESAHSLHSPVQISK